MSTSRFRGTLLLTVHSWSTLFVSVLAGGPEALVTNNRSLAEVVQNINGMSSLFALIPVLTGKLQNVKLIAARTFPAALTLAGLGAGRGLSKLQMGLLLVHCELYRNVVDTFSYHHDEYVNKFAPPLIHKPTGTPERHSSNAIINHNITEDYMVEAWFQTQGRPAQIELSQNGNRRTFVGILAFLLLHAVETFLGVRTAAANTGLALIIMQATTAFLWIGGICVIQANRGQGMRFFEVNGRDSPDYRCYQLVTLGDRIQSAVLSTHMDNIRSYKIFNSQYENRMLTLAGGAILASGFIDIIATILIVGLTRWAYWWLAYQVVIVFLKLACSLEPLREQDIKSIQPLIATPMTPLSQPAPLPATSGSGFPILINTTPEFTFLAVLPNKNVVLEHASGLLWQSRSSGLWVGQPYYSMEGSDDKELVRYLVDVNKQLTLDVAEPNKESNDALQREFLACLAAVVNANKVASHEFVAAVKSCVDLIRPAMDPEWFDYGSKDILQALTKCRRNIFWRHTA